MKEELEVIGPVRPVRLRADLRRGHVLLQPNRAHVAARAPTFACALIAPIVIDPRLPTPTVVSWPAYARRCARGVTSTARSCKVKPPTTSSLTS
jgi:hypothetical protein